LQYQQQQQQQHVATDAVTSAMFGNINISRTRANARTAMGTRRQGSNPGIG